MEMFRGASDNAGNCIFIFFKLFNLREWKSMVKRVAIIKTKVNKGSGDSSGGGKVKSMTDTTEVTMW